jgi:dTDP-4-amino-4,6-dideoxygalactose transaminase
VARDPRDTHANHLFVIRVTFADRDDVQRAMTEENIGTSIHFLPVHLLSAYRDRLAPNQPPLPVAERAGTELLSMPTSPAHSDDDVRDAVAALRRVHARLAG